MEHPELYIEKYKKFEEEFMIKNPSMIVSCSLFNREINITLFFLLINITKFNDNNFFIKNKKYICKIPNSITSLKFSNMFRGKVENNYSFRNCVTTIISTGEKCVCLKVYKNKIHFSGSEKLEKIIPVENKIIEYINNCDDFLKNLQENDFRKIKFNVLLDVKQDDEKLSDHYIKLKSLYEMIVENEKDDDDHLLFIEYFGSFYKLEELEEKIFNYALEINSTSFTFNGIEYDLEENEKYHIFLAKKIITKYNKNIINYLESNKNKKIEKSQKKLLDIYIKYIKTKKEKYFNIVVSFIEIVLKDMEKGIDYIDENVKPIYEKLKKMQKISKNINFRKRITNTFENKIFINSKDKDMEMKKDFLSFFYNIYKSGKNILSFYHKLESVIGFIENQKSIFNDEESLDISVIGREEICVNYNYKLGYKVLIPIVSQYIENSNTDFVTINDLNSKYTKILLPFEKEYNIIKRKKEKFHKFLLYNTGEITHSGPSQELMKDAYCKFMILIDGMKDNIKQ